MTTSEDSAAGPDFDRAAPTDVGSSQAGDVTQDLDETAIRLLLLGFRIAERYLLSRVSSRGFSDIRMTHFPIMRSLNQGVSRMADIAEMTKVTKQTAAALAAELEDIGYISRQPDPEDRRAKIVRFTPRGEAFMSELPTIMKETEGYISETVGNDDLDDLVRILRKFVASSGGDLPGMI